VVEVPTSTADHELPYGSQKLRVGMQPYDFLETSKRFAVWTLQIFYFAISIVS
jgi:hypothetical protein